MKINSATVLLAMLLIPPLVRAQDHLEPETGVLLAARLERAYSQNVATVLFKGGPEDYLARMVCLPSFEAEWAVTISNDEKPNYAVEYVVAEKPIWGAKAPRDTKVRRSIKPIDPETARLAHLAFRRMLRGVRYPDAPRWIDDGETYSFSRRVPGFDGMIVFGQPPDATPGHEEGQIRSPDEGTPTARLVGIGEALKRYTLADSDAMRDAIREEIRRESKRLEAKPAPPAETEAPAKAAGDGKTTEAPRSDIE